MAGTGQELDRQSPNERSLNESSSRTSPAPSSRPRRLYEPMQSQDASKPDDDTSRSEPAAKSTAESMLISESAKEGRPGSTKSKRRSATVAFWWQEIVAVVLLCVSVVASYATLTPYQDKALPKWPLKITISALLSTYSVVLRTAATFLIAEGLSQLKWRWFSKGSAPLHDIVLHDSATRGPIGSLQLLWRLPWPNTWQWAGCILGVASLATGPLTQLAIEYETCSVPTADQDASVPRTQVFFGQGPAGIGTYEAYLSASEQNAINVGIYSSSPVGFECSSGNCTFEPYKSIGYCSSCEDLSSEMQFVVSNRTEGFGYNYSSFYSFVAVKNSYFEGTVGVNFTTQDTDAVAATAQVAYGTGAENGFVVVIGTPNFVNNTLPDCSSNRTWTCQGYAAASCELFPCIREYTAQVVRGSFEESVINQWNKSIFNSGFWGDGSETWSTTYKPCLSTQERSQLRALSYPVDEDGLWLGYNGSMHGDVNSTQSAMEQDLLDRHCLYAVDASFDDGLGISQGPFNGSVIANNEGINSFSPDYYTGPQLMLAIYNSGGMSFERTQSIFSNMSLSLTNYMRVNPYGGSGHGIDHAVSASHLYPKVPTGPLNLDETAIPALGVVNTTKTCLQVRWGWLAFPTSIAGLTLVFFVGVLFSSASLTRDVRTWKSSPLPLLFFGLLGVPKTSQHTDDLEVIAKSTCVRLLNDDEGNMVLRKQGALLERPPL